MDTFSLLHTYHLNYILNPNTASTKASVYSTLTVHVSTSLIRSRWDSSHEYAEEVTEPERMKGQE